MLRNSLITKSRKSKDVKKKTRKTKKSTKSKKDNTEPKKVMRRSKPNKDELKKGYYGATIVINNDLDKFRSPLYIHHEGKEIGYIYNIVNNITN